MHIAPGGENRGSSSWEIMLLLRPSNILSSQIEIRYFTEVREREREREVYYGDIMQAQV